MSPASKREDLASGENALASARLANSPNGDFVFHMTSLKSKNPPFGGGLIRCRAIYTSMDLHGRIETRLAMWLTRDPCARTIPSVYTKDPPVFSFHFPPSYYYPTALPGDFEVLQEYTRINPRHNRPKEELIHRLEKKD
jgi:hypothetical protein